VYGALDTETGESVAVKVLPKKAATRGAVLRFRREGQAALVVQHPHIIRTVASDNRAKPSSTHLQ